MGKLVFQPLGIKRNGIVIGLAVFAAFFVFVTVQVWRDDGMHLWGAIGWTAATGLVFAWLGYWYLIRFSLRTTYDGNQLTWQTGFAAGAVPLSELTGIRSRLFTVVEIGTTAGRVTLMPARGYDHLLNAIISDRPDLKPESFRMIEIPIRAVRSTRVFYEE